MALNHNNWTIMSPFLRVQLAGIVYTPPKAGEREEDALRYWQYLTNAMVTHLSCIPGVREKNGTWEVPENAVSIFLDTLEQYNCLIQSANWGREPVKTTSWESIEPLLKQEGLREEYLGDWPKKHQKEALCNAWNMSGYHLWHTTGAGKTFTGICLSLSVPGRVLVITRSAARIQISREIERFVDTKAYVIRSKSSAKKEKTSGGYTWRMFFQEHMPLLGKAKLVADAWKEHQKQHGIVITEFRQSLAEYAAQQDEAGQRAFAVVGWEALVDHADSIEEYNPSSIIYDEMHMGKGRERFDTIHLRPLPPESQPDLRAQQIAEDEKECQERKGFIKEIPDEDDPTGDPQRVLFVPVINRASYAALLSRNVQKRICMTATPIADRVRDLWAQLDTAEPNAWGSKTTWLQRYADYKRGKYGWDDSGSSHLEELIVRMEKSTHKVPTHVAQAELLNFKRRQSVYISLEDQCAPLGGFSKEIKQAQIVGGTSLVEALMAQAASKKRKAVLDLVDSHVKVGHKICIFTGRRIDCDELKKLCASVFKKVQNFTVWGAHGDTQLEHRQLIVDEYMAHPGPCILVGTLQAFGQSINLQDTDAGFFVMLPWTPEMLRQGEGRWVRFGMNRAVIIYYCIAEGTIDEVIASRLIEKLPAVAEVAEDEELGEARTFLAGFNEDETEEEFADSILALLDE